MANNINQIISYIPDFNAVERGFNKLISINSVLTQKLQSDLGGAFNVQSLNINKLVRSFDGLANSGNFSAVIKNANGQLKTLSSNFKLVTDAANPANSSVQLLNQTIKDGGQSAKFFGVNIGELAKRAALTIPIWFALRGAIIGIPQALAQGVKDLIEFDKQLQKIKRNLTGSASEIEAGFAKVRAEVTRLSLETGKSTAEIADAVKQFATLGFGVEDSLSGANAAVKASVLFFEDAGKTAEAFAGSMKILQDRSQGAANFSQQFNEALALAVELEKDNRSELGPLSEALQKFAPAALNAGISMRETVTLLASLGTAGRGGASGATLLRSSVNELLSSLGQLAPELGVFVDQADSTFDVLLKVIDAGDKLSSSGLIADRAKVTEAFSNIFGGERGTQVVAALSAVNEQLRKNNAVLPDINNFYKQYNDLLEKSSAIQRDQLNTGLVELRKSFIDAVVGGGDGLLQLLKNLNSTIQTLTPVLNTLGSTINTIFANLGTIAGVAFIVGIRKLITVGTFVKIFGALGPFFTRQGLIAGTLFSGAFRRALLTQLAPNLLVGITGGLVAGLGKSLIQGFGRILGLLANPLVGIGLILGQVLVGSITEGFVRNKQKLNDAANESFSTLVEGLQGKLNNVQLRQLIVDVQIGKIDTNGVDRAVVQQQLLKLLEEGLNKEKEITKEKEKQVSIFESEIGLQTRLFQAQLRSTATNQSTIDSLTQQIKIYKQIEESVGLSADSQQKLADLQKDLVVGLAGQQAAINNTLLNNAVERLKSEGATQSVILKATQAYRDQLGINVDLNTRIDERLQRERAATAEKRLQNKLSSDSVKLFEIAQANGTQAAKAIGDVLSGNTSFETFFRKGGENLEIFKNQFADVFKQQQAQSFFQGNFLKGFQELRGGTGVSIQDRGALQTNVPRFDANLALQQARTNADQLSQLQNINVQAALKIDVTGLSFDKARDKIVDEVAQSVFNRIREKGSPERATITEVIEDF